MKNQSEGKILFYIILGVAIVLIATVGATYAYFTANLTGTESSTTIIVTGGTMTIAYSGGANITATNISPKAAAIGTKNFTVTGNNTTDLTMSYKLTLEVTTNTFQTNSLVWRLTSINTGSNGTVAPAKSTDQNIATGVSSIDLGTGLFTGPTGGGKVHTYGLTLYFPYTASDQNNDQGKTFNAYVKTVNV